jgi:GNAT superfamily N-acetyltransferase
MADWIIRRLSTNDERPSFDCGDQDLNEFFAVDSIKSGIELLSVTYVVQVGSEIAAFFSLSNDSIRKDLLEKSIWRKLTGFIPFQKRYSTLPAVKIGRFATSIKFQGDGLGTEILNFLKHWFTDGNKTGCRFIIVDVYNKEKTIKFYDKNGFSFLFSSDKDDKTRLMVFDLMTVKQ